MSVDRRFQIHFFFYCVKRKKHLSIDIFLYSLYFPKQQLQSDSQPSFALFGYGFTAATGNYRQSWVTANSPMSKHRKSPATIGDRARHIQTRLRQDEMKTDLYPKKEELLLFGHTWKKKEKSGTNQKTALGRKCHRLGWRWEWWRGSWWQQSSPAPKISAWIKKTTAIAGSDL